MTRQKKTIQESVSNDTTAKEIQQPIETEQEIVEEKQGSSIQELLKEITEMESALKTHVKHLSDAYKSLRIQVKAELKSAKKRKPRRTDSEKKGSFKPVKLSPELSKFLGKPSGSIVERGEVTSLIYKYIQSHKLYYNDQPKTFMKPDAKLEKLLGPFDYPNKTSDPSKGTGLSIYNIQKYLQNHFVSV